MTFEEKNIILSALAEYEKSERKKEMSFRKRGESGKAMEHMRNACMASGLVSFWASTLPEPAGTVKI